MKYQVITKTTLFNALNHLLIPKPTTPLGHLTENIYSNLSSPMKFTDLRRYLSHSSDKDFTIQLANESINCPTHSLLIFI